MMRRMRMRSKTEKRKERLEAAACRLGWCSAWIPALAWPHGWLGWPLPRQAPAPPAAGGRIRLLAPPLNQSPHSSRAHSFCSLFICSLSSVRCHCPLPHSPHPPPSGLTEEAQKMPQHLRGFQHFPPSPHPPLRWAPQTRPPPQRREPPQHRPPRPPCQCQHSPCPGPTSSPPPSSCPSSATLC